MQQFRQQWYLLLHRARQVERQFDAQSEWLSIHAELAQLQQFERQRFAKEFRGKHNSASSGHAAQADGNTAPVTVSGTILSSGKAVANVPIYSTSAAVVCTRTDAKGAYTCRVPASWSGLLIPIMGGYQFSPSAYGFDKVNANTAGKNFQARVLKR